MLTIPEILLIKFTRMKHYYFISEAANSEFRDAVRPLLHFYETAMQHGQGKDREEFTRKAIIADTMQRGGSIEAGISRFKWLQALKHIMDHGIRHHDDLFTELTFMWAERLWHKLPQAMLADPDTVLASLRSESFGETDARPGKESLVLWRWYRGDKRLRLGTIRGWEDTYAVIVGVEEDKKRWYQVPVAWDDVFPHPSCVVPLRMQPKSVENEPPSSPVWRPPAEPDVFVQGPQSPFHQIPGEPMPARPAEGQRVMWRADANGHPQAEGVIAPGGNEDIASVKVGNAEPTDMLWADVFPHPDASPPISQSFASLGTWPMVGDKVLWRADMTDTVLKAGVIREATRGENYAMVHPAGEPVRRMMFYELLYPHPDVKLVKKRRVSSKRTHARFRRESDEFTD